MQIINFLKNITFLSVKIDFVLAKSADFTVCQSTCFGVSYKNEVEKRGFEKASVNLAVHLQVHFYAPKGTLGGI